MVLIALEMFTTSVTHSQLFYMSNGPIHTPLTNDVLYNLPILLIVYDMTCEKGDI